MATDAARAPSALDTRARQRARRREQAAAAAARAGGMLSLAVVLLGSPVAVGQHGGHSAGIANRAGAHAPTRAGDVREPTRRSDR